METIFWLCVGLGLAAVILWLVLALSETRSNAYVALKKLGDLPWHLETRYREILLDALKQRDRQNLAQALSAPIPQYWVSFTLYYHTSQYEIQTEGRGAWVPSGRCHDFQLFLDRPALEHSWVHVHGPCSITQIKVGNCLITGTHSQESSVLGVRIQDPIHVGQRLGVQVRAHSTVRDPLDQSSESKEVAYCGY